MYPVIDLFGKEFGSYAICAMVGFFLSVLCAYKLGKKDNVHFEDLVLLFLAAAGGLVVGGHLLYGLTNIDKVVKLFGLIGEVPFLDFVTALGTLFGGMVFYGGFLGGIAGVWIFTRLSKDIPKEHTMDLYAVTVPLFHTFGRIGCFLGGCCYGIESSFGFTVHGNTYSPDINDVQRFPVQLVEAGLNLAIFFVLLTLYRSGRFKKRLIYLYMLIYPPVRFLLEFLRGDAIRGFLFGLSTSQWISMILFAISVGTFLYWRFVRRPEQVQESLS